jgi:hypothetical protein
MQQVGVCNGSERLACALLEVASTTTMAMQVNAAGNHVHAMCVNHLVHAV